MIWHRTKTILVAFLILGLPIVLTLCLQSGKNQYKTLPVLGPKEVNNEGDTVYHKIGSFSFTNQDGEKVTSEQLEGKFYVAHFFYTKCPDVCPKLMDNLKEVQKQTRNIENFRMLSITVNPESDTPQRLKEYAQENGINTNKWHLLSGEQANIEALAQDKFLITAKEDQHGYQNYVHSDLLVLVDKEGKIRGFYKGSDEQALETLVDQVAVLLEEYE